MSSRTLPVSSLLAPLLLLYLLWPGGAAFAQGAREWRAVVADERLSALRQSPGFDGPFLRRLGRGRRVRVFASRTSGGVEFCRVAVTRRTRGWIQRASLFSPQRSGDDDRLLRLIRGSEGYDKIARARLHLKYFPHSRLRPEALLLLGEAAERVSADLTRDARRRLSEAQLSAGNAPAETYFLNYAGLDRYARLGVNFHFETRTNRYQYDGASWRELLRRYPHRPEAARAGEHLKMRGRPLSGPGGRK